MALLDSTLTDAPLLIDGHRFWLVNGRLRPLVCGAEGGEGEGEGEGGGEGGEGAGEGGDGGAGGGDELPSDPDELRKLLADAKAEGEKWKGLSKKHEDRSKLNHAELEKLRKAGLGENERAVDEAREAGKAEARAEVAQMLAAARIEAALTGVVADPSTVVEDLNLAKFVTDDGQVDSEAVTALKAKYQQFGGKSKFEGGADGGARGKSKVGQLSRDDLKSMTPDEIVKAKADGRLNDLLGIS